MANMKVELNILNPKIDKLVMSNYNRASSYTGQGYLNSKISENNSQSDCFVVGSSIVGNSVYLGKYSGYLSDCGSGNNEYMLGGSPYGYSVDNGISAGEFAITVTGSGISKINIRFDSKLGSYPTVLYVNEIMFVNSGFEFSHTFSREQSNVIIRIVAMSKPMKPIAISRIDFGENFKTDTSNGLLSVNIIRQSTNGSQNIEYGVISQSADFTFVDNNGEIGHLISRGNNFKNVPAKIYLDGNLVGTFFSQAEWKYSVYSRRVNVSLNDRLVKWQDAKIKMQYNGESMSLLNVVEYLIENSGDFKFEIEPYTRDFISKINIELPYLIEDTIWEQWNKVANIGQFVVYLLTNGTVYVKRVL